MQVDGAINRYGLVKEGTKNIANRVWGAISKYSLRQQHLMAKSDAETAVTWHWQEEVKSKAF